MKKEKEAYNKTVKDYIDKLTTPIFEKALQETKKNRTLVGSQKKISNIYSLYSPHNYRLYFDFKKEDFHPLRPSKPTYKTDGGRLGLKNSKEWVTKEQILGCNLIVKKTQIQINNLIEPKRWHLILMGDIAKRKQQVMEIHQKKINQGIRALKSFLEAYGGKSEFKLLRVWCEEKIMQDKPIDKLPLNMFFKAQNVKKDYNEPNIEYFGDPVGAANYFSNRGIEDIAPRISDSINNLGNQLIPTIRSLDKSIQMEIHNKKIHLEVLKNIDKSFKRFNKLLSQTNLRKWL